MYILRSVSVSLVHSLETSVELESLDYMCVEYVHVYLNVCVYVHVCRHVGCVCVCVFRLDSYCQIIWQGCEIPTRGGCVPLTEILASHVAYPFQSN